MKITVLTENNSRIDNYLLSEPALSLYIEVEGKRILFDCGYSDATIKNAKKLNIDLNNLTDIVLFHGHNDHSAGLIYLPKNKKTNLIAHPNIFDKKVDCEGVEYGMPISKKELEDKFNLNLTKEAYRINENLYYLGQIENNFSKDIDDSGLVYKSQKGLIIIVGCSHAGIINIINHARKLFKNEKIYTIFGGMHLLNASSNDLTSISDKLLSESINHIYPCHCCDLNSKIALSKHLKVKEVCTGDSFTF